MSAEIKSRLEMQVGAEMKFQADKAAEPSEFPILSDGSPAFTERHRGSGRRFEWRVFGSEHGQRYEVYAPGLVQVAECLTAESARMVCDALNALPENGD